MVRSVRHFELVLNASSGLVGLKMMFVNLAPNLVAAGVNLPSQVVFIAEPNFLLSFNLNDLAVMNQDLDRPEANLRQSG